VLQYDDVMNRQRELIYSQRRMVLTGADVKQNVMDMLDTLIDDIFSVYCPEGTYPEEWDISGMTEYFNKVFLPKGDTLFGDIDITELKPETAKDIIKGKARALYQLKEQEIEQSGQSMREIERILLLRVVDQKWMAHIDAMDQLRQGIGLRAYGQRDPVIEYRREGFDMFEQMVHEIQQDTVTMLYHVKITTKPKRSEAPKPIAPPKKVVDSSGNKVGRNALCPCGSGKKFKNCCGKGK
jgi:preprotein translocase subunit SecA